MKTKDSKWRLVIGLALILVAACVLVMSGTLAKYRTEMVIANEVDYTNQLAESFKLLDYPVITLEDGSYERDESADAEPTSGCAYKLIPGVTLPAAPYVEIKGKTEIPAYLYLEVENTGGAELSFDGKWSALTGVAGKKGGTVYVYDGGVALTGDGGDEVLTVVTFTIDTLSKYPENNPDAGEIKVYAYMIQKAEDTDAADAFSQALSV